MNVILSIHPEYVEKIISEEKKYEFRRKIFKQDVEQIVVYSTCPVKRIECIFEIKEIFEETPEQLWENYHDFGCISKKKFFKYFENTDKGYAIEIKNVKKLIKPIDKFNEDFTIPQSFRYLSEEEFNLIVESNLY